jgi:hypothetical protein
MIGPPHKQKTSLPGPQGYHSDLISLEKPAFKVALVKGSGSLGTGKGIAREEKERDFY